MENRCWQHCLLQSLREVRTCVSLMIFGNSFSPSIKMIACRSGKMRNRFTVAFKTRNRTNCRGQMLADETMKERCSRVARSLSSSGTSVYDVWFMEFARLKKQVFDSGSSYSPNPRKSYRSQETLLQRRLKRS